MICWCFFLHLKFFRKDCANIYVMGPIDVACEIQAQTADLVDLRKNALAYGCNTCPKFCACMALVNFPVVIFYSHLNF